MKKQLLTLCFTLFATTNIFALPPLLETTNYQTSSIKHLDFNMSWENLEIKKSNDNKITVEVYCNKKKFAPRVLTSGSGLLIETSASTRLFSWEKKSCTVIVYIPAGKEFDKTNIHLLSGDVKNEETLYADSINIQTLSGDINTEGLNAKQISVTASSGDIEIKSVNSERTLVNANSGNIKINAIDSKTFTAKTLSGDQKYKSINANDLDFAAASGNIKISDGAVQNISISTSSGNISVEDLLTNKFSVSSSSGTIGLELKAAPLKNSNASTSSGTLFVSMPKDAAATIRATTSSGGFTNSFTREKLSSHANYKQDINGGGATISLNSSSGNITLDVGDGVSATGRFIIDDTQIDDEDIPVVNIDRPIF